MVKCFSLVELQKMSSDKYLNVNMSIFSSIYESIILALIIINVLMLLEDYILIINVD